MVTFGTLSDVAELGPMIVVGRDAGATDCGGA
jgi:hypothetical protein